MRSSFAACVTIATFAAAAGAQGPPINQVRAELRLVSQLGTPPGAVLSYYSPQHPDVTSPVGAARRFEVQYRLVDINTTDAIVPAGLFSAQLTIWATGGTLQRALLSGNESGSLSGGGTLPPVSQSVNLDLDNSGSAANSAAGMHRPFRGGIPAPAPNNTNLANGVFQNGATLLSGISPLSLTQNNQNDGGWYGLYSFVFLPVEVTGSVNAAFVTDGTTNGRVGFFDLNNASGGTTTLATSDTVEVVVPAPAGGGAAMVLAGACMARRRRRTEGAVC